MAGNGQSWSEDELTAAVKAYLNMLADEQAGRKFVKSEVNRQLREGALCSRTKASVEYRMQNISAALDLAGQDFIEGYKPAKNVGANVIDQLQQMLQKHEIDLFQPTADPQVLEKRVKAAIKLNRIAEKPAGYSVPKKEPSSINNYARCPRVKAWVLQRAKGICEGCRSAAPFVNSAGDPYLEVHHIQYLADGGADTVNNTAALCPNCHRRCHYSEDRVEFGAGLRERVVGLSV